jgi:hypothetical protein
MFVTSDAMALPAAEGPAREVADRLRGIDALRAGGLIDRERVVGERPAVRLLADVGDFGLGRAAAVAENYGSVAFESFIAIERLCILFEAVCDRAQKSRHRGALILAPSYGLAGVGVGILVVYLC